MEEAGNACYVFLCLMIWTSNVVVKMMNIKNCYSKVWTQNTEHRPLIHGGKTKEKVASMTRSLHPFLLTLWHYTHMLHCTQFIVLCTGDWWASTLVELVNKRQRVWLQILIHTGASIIVRHHSICFFDGLQVRNTHLFVREEKKLILFGSLYLPVYLIHKHEREATRLSARHLDQRSSGQVSIMVSWNWLWGESHDWHHRKDLISTHTERKRAWLWVRPCETARVNQSYTFTTLRWLGIIILL